MGKFVFVGVALLVGCGSKSSTPDATTTDAMQYLPKDAEFIIAADVAQIRSGPLSATIKEAISTDSDYQGAVAKCGFDPMAKVDRVLMSGSGRDNNHGVVVVKGNAKDVIGCIAKLDDSKLDGDSLQLSTNDSAFVVANASTLVGVYGDDVKVDQARDLVKHGGGLAKDSGFASLYKTVDTHRALWIAAQGTFLKTVDLDPTPRSLTASLDIASKVGLDATIRFQSKADADAAIATYGEPIKTTLPSGTMNVKQNDADVTVTISLTSAATKDLLNTFKSGW